MQEQVRNGSDPQSTPSTIPSANTPPSPPAGTGTEPQPTEIRDGRGLGGLLTGVFALLIAVGAVACFAVLQSAVACPFRPITYAIFTAIALAAVGSVFGGQAVIRGNIAESDIKWVVGGGAGFLLIAMIGVWWATHGAAACTALTPALRLESFPSQYLLAQKNPAPAEGVLRVRFDSGISAQQSNQHAGYVDYDLFLTQPPEGGDRSVSVYLDLVGSGNIVEVCKIDVKFRDNDDLGGSSEIFRPHKDTMALRFRPTFIDELHDAYHFDKPYAHAHNTCIEIERSDRGKDELDPVNEIFFVRPSVTDKIKSISFPDLSPLRRDFEFVLELGSSAAREHPSEPLPPPPPPPSAREAPPAPAAVAACDPHAPAAPVADADLDKVVRTGSLERSELRDLYSDWCHQEAKFYEKLTTSDDPDLRYRLIKFLRASITALDVCWASSDDYRHDHAGTVSCTPKLDQPRNLSRPLPLAAKPEQKAAIIRLLRDDKAAVRREVESLLKSYPHDDFGPLLDEFSKAKPKSPEIQEPASAAVGYYYNRVVEQQWAKTIDAAKAVDSDLSRGLTWARALNTPDDAAALARLHYARAQVYLQISKGTPPPALDQKVAADFAELVKLPEDAAAIYPYPYHLARAVVHNAGKPSDFARFGGGEFDFDQFEREPASKTIDFSPSLHEPKLFVVPDTSGTELGVMPKGSKIRVLMHYAPKGKGAWDFVWTGRGLGWLKRTANPA
jgi:hypothetical protein